jgi:hypothetical protein
MGKKYNRIQWVVQQNLTSEDTFDNIERACRQIGVGCVPLQIIPFTDSLPSFERLSVNIPYGSTTFGLLASRDADLCKGYFMNENFNMRVYLERWGRHMLNHGATLVAMTAISPDLHSSDEMIFVRPLDDSKSFSGAVMKFSELLTWRDQLAAVTSNDRHPIGEILISEPFHISREWRLWIVNGTVISATRYREDFRLSKEKGCPEGVRTFAEERCREFVPHDVFVMDIGESADQFYIIECGCMNSAGFYKGDIDIIVQRVTEYMTDKN